MDRLMLGKAIAGVHLDRSFGLCWSWFESVFSRGRCGWCVFAEHASLTQWPAESAGFGYGERSDVRLRCVVYEQ
jgi:hypothetical protein